MAEEFNYEKWKTKTMAIPLEEFDKEIKRIDAERDKRCSRWLKKREEWLNPKGKVKREEEVPSKMVPPFQRKGDNWQKGLD